MRWLLAIFVSLILLYLVYKWCTDASEPQSLSSSTIIVPVASDARPVQQANTLEDGVQERELPFSWLGQDMSQGNPASWAGRPNPGDPYRPGQMSLCFSLQKQYRQSYNCPKQQAEVVIQGHSVPLPHELYASREEGGTIVPFARERASLACCPSSYQTDRGCVCGV